MDAPRGYRPTDMSYLATFLQRGVTDAGSLLTHFAPFGSAPTAETELNERVAATPTILSKLTRENEQLRRVVHRLRKFENLALIDELTRLYNRRCFERRFSEEWSRAVRHKTPLALLIADVDNLKAINDRAGHRRGDEVLAWVGSVLAKTCRCYDVACRIGGDEFALILPNTDHRGAKAVLKRLHQNQRNTRNRPLMPNRSPAGLSIGCAVMPHDALRADDLYSRADAAMYADKRRRKSVVRRLG